MIHNANPITDAILDSTALIVALAVSILMLLVTFTGIAPDLPTRIGMGSISIVVGFFGVRGWLSKTGLGLVLCILFGTVEVFSHTSFALISTNLQATAAKVAEVKIEDDPEYKRLTERATKLQTTADALASKVANLSEGFRSEVDIRQGGVESANKAATEASDAVGAYLRTARQTSSQGVSAEAHVRIDADLFFTAIPDALTSGKPARWIAFFFSVIIFAGVQITVLIAADGMMTMMDKKRREKEEEDLEKEAEKEQEVRASRPKVGRKPGVVRTIPKKVTEAWVDALWHDYRDGTSDKIIDRGLTLKFLIEKKIPITKRYDDKLFDLAIKLKLFDSDGTIHKTAMEAKTALDEAQKRKE